MDDTASSKILQAVEGKCTLEPHGDGFYFDWPGRDRGRMFATPAQLKRLEEKLDVLELHTFDDVFLGSAALVLKSGDKVVHITRKPINAPEMNVVNPTLAEGAISDELYFTISQFRPDTPKQAAYFGAIQAALLAEHGVMFTDISGDTDNVRTEKAEITLYDEKGAMIRRDVDVPWIIDAESPHFEAPFAEQGAGSASAYLGMALQQKDMTPVNMAVRTSHHEVLIFKDKPLYDAFCRVLGETQAAHYQTTYMDTSRLKFGADHVPDPTSYGLTTAYIIALPNPEITVRHSESGEENPFSLRLLMDEANRLLAEKQQR